MFMCAGMCVGVYACVGVYVCICKYVCVCVLSVLELVQ